MSAERKQEQDLTKETDEIIPVAESLAKEGKLQEALDKLLAHEKVTRNAADLASTRRTIIAILTILHSRNEFDLLCQHITLLAKKHGQLRQAVQAMVEGAMKYLDGYDGDTLLKLIEVLREVTEGKIYVEVPRARLTRQLSAIKEAGGDLVKASDLLQELQVETFGSMDRREKIDFILEQMRLLRAREDWDMLNIVSKKINTKWLVGAENEDLKLRYYNLMIQYSLHTMKHLDTCKYYRSMYETESIQADESKWSPVLQNIVYFVVLAPYDNEQYDLLERIMRDEKVSKLQVCYDLGKCFTTPELMRWPKIEQEYGGALRQTKVFGPPGVQGVPGDIDEDSKQAKGDKRWEELQDRVVEHNIRVVSKYYTRITLSHLAVLLDLPASRAEEILSRLVVSKTVYAKIDRPAGTINFVERKGVDKILNEWSSDVTKLMGLVEKTCHLISKEHAVHAALKGVKS